MIIGTIRAPVNKKQPAPFANLTLKAPHWKGDLVKNQVSQQQLQSNSERVTVGKGEQMHRNSVITIERRRLIVADTSVVVKICTVGDLRRMMFVPVCQPYGENILIRVWNRWRKRMVGDWAFVELIAGP